LLANYFNLISKVNNVLLGVVIMDAEEPQSKSDSLQLSVIAFSEKRHTESIEGISTVSHPWRMKERVIF
jgi:hypothetical protein